MGTVHQLHDPFAPEPRRSARALPFVAPRDIANMPEAQVDWVVKGLLARGCLTELTADIRAGKTTFTAQEVRAMREGRPFLGQPTRWTRVYWLTEEMPPAFLQTLHRAHLADCDEGEISVVFRYQVQQMAWPDLVRRCVEDDRRQGGGGLLIVDTLSRFVGLGPDAENDAGAAAKAMDPLLLAARQGMAVKVHRHARRGGGGPGSAGRGSSAWSADADIILVLRRPPRADADEELTEASGTRILEAASRFTETPAQDEPTTIKLTGDGYGLLEQATIREQRYHHIDAQIILYAGNHLGCTRTDIRNTAEVTGKGTLKLDRVTHLVQSGLLIERLTEHRNGRGLVRSRTGLFVSPSA